MASATLITIQPDSSTGKDAWLNSYYPGSNNGNNQYLSVNLSDNNFNSGLIEFDLDFLAGVHVNSATLSLYHVSSPATGAAITAYQNTSSWAENTVTYATSPSYSTVSFTALTMADNDMDQQIWRDLGLTAITQNWLSDPLSNYGLTITTSLNTFNGTRFYLASSDYENPVNQNFHPKLTIDYVANPVPEPTTLLLFGMGIAGLAGSILRRKKA